MSEAEVTFPVVLIGSERFVTVAVAARRLRVSRQRVHQWIRRGDLPSTRVERQHYIAEEAVAAKAASRAGA